MALGEGGNWEQATGRIVNMIGGGKGADPLEGLLPEGYGSTKTVESHARAFAEANSVDLAMIFPVLLAAFSAATQGGFAAPLYSEDRTPNPVSLVFQFFGIAESGARKSTVLKEGKSLLELALAKGVANRRSWCSAAQKKAMKKAEAVGVAVDTDRAAWDKVFAGGICASTLADSGTQEGLRNKLIQNGGHRAVLTGESDILREVGQYSKSVGGAGLGLFIRTWDQEAISVDRASDAHLYIPEASMPFLIFVQPNSFTQHTGVTKEGYDEWTDKGVFGRAWLWRMPEPIIPETFAFKAKPQPVKKTGAALEATPLMQARLRSGEALELLVERSDEYRAIKGIHYAWEALGSVGDIRADHLPAMAEREMLELDGAAGEAAFVAVQNMLLTLRRSLKDAEATDPGSSAMFHPLVARFTDHVMRLATLLSLADAPDTLTVDTDHIIDVATRIMPWLWSGWVEVMDFRRTANTESVMADQMLKNHGFESLTMDSVILRAMVKLAESDGPSSEAGFAAGKVVDRARSTLPPAQRRGVNADLRSTLVKLAAEGKLVQRLMGAGPADALGKHSDLFKLTAAGHAVAPKK